MEITESMHQVVLLLLPLASLTRPCPYAATFLNTVIIDNIVSIVPLPPLTYEIPRNLLVQLAL
jgi:hypothetical protein